MPYDVIVNTAPQLKFKTADLNKTEFRSLLTEIEKIRLDKAIAKIDGDLSWLPTNAAKIDMDAAPLGKPGFLYRDVLRSAFAAYTDASTYSMNNPDLIAGLNLNAYFGLLDSPSRVAVILQGLPLA